MPAKAPPPKTAAKAASPKAAAAASAAKAPSPKADNKKSAAKAPAPKKAPVKETKQRTAAPGNSNGVYVKNWGQGSVEDAKSVFGSAGKVVSAQVRRRRYAIIFFENSAAVKKAIDLFNEKEVLGNVVTVVPAKTSPKPDPHEGSSVVFVSPIFRTSTTKQQIHELFEGMKVQRLRTYRGNYAYIYLDSPAAALKAMKEKNGTEFRGKKLRVALSTRSLQKDRERAMRARVVTDAHKFGKMKNRR